MTLNTTVNKQFFLAKNFFKYVVELDFEKMQLYEDQLRNKHASFHKEIQPAVKGMLLK